MGTYLWVYRLSYDCGNFKILSIIVSQLWQKFHYFWIAPRIHPEDWGFPLTILKYGYDIISICLKTVMHPGVMLLSPIESSEAYLRDTENKL